MDVQAGILDRVEDKDAIFSNEFARSLMPRTTVSGAGHFCRGWFPPGMPEISTRNKMFAGIRNMGDAQKVSSTPSPRSNPMTAISL